MEAEITQKTATKRFVAQLQENEKKYIYTHYFFTLFYANMQC